MVAMSTKPAIKITAGDVPARGVARLNLVLVGGHLDGLPISEVEVPGIWPEVTTLERWTRPSDDLGTLSFITRVYTVCLCTGRVQLDRRRRVMYCLERTG